jgi:hypothetical protein
MSYTVVAPISHYSFNDNAATTNVIAALGLDGTANFNTSDKTIAGKVSTALGFTSGNYITCGTVAANGWDLQVFSIAFWFKPLNNIDGNSGQQCATDAGSRVTVGFYPQAQGSDGELMGIYYNGGWKVTGTGITTWSNSTWYHVVYTVDTVNHVQKIYVNGVLINTTTETAVVSYSTARQCGFGREILNSIRHWLGGLDDMRIYDYVLVQADIDAIYNGGVGTPDSTIIISDEVSGFMTCMRGFW